MIELPVLCSAETVRRIRAGKPVRIWVREKFACRLNGDLLRVRFAADGPDGPTKSVPAANVPKQFHSATYVSHPAKHMLRVLSRLTLLASLEPDRR